MRFLPLSGKSDAALRDAAGRYLQWLDERDLSEPSTDRASLSDMAWTASVGRSHFTRRVGVVFRDGPSLRDALASLADEAEPSDRPVTRDNPKVAFVYTGQASQWIGMARNIYESEPVARAVIDRCDALLTESRGVSLKDVMFGDSDATSALDDPTWTQPAIYVLECALTAQWASLGVRPDVVVGHSLGEIAAAQAAGVFSLEEGLGFAERRGDLIAALPEKGAMAVVFATTSDVAAALEEHNANCDGPGLCLAAYNGTNQAISGPESDVVSILAHFEADNIRTARLRASPAYHSALVDPALDGLEAYFADVAVAEPKVTMVSSLSGECVEPRTRLDGSYWRTQARQPVAFDRCVQKLAELDVDVVIEIGPHGVLTPLVALGWPAEAQAPAAFASLRRPSREESLADVEGSFMAAVASAYEAGVPLAFEGLFAGEERRRISLPGYPFQRRHHWIEAPRRQRRQVGDPLLGVRHESPRGEIDFETEIHVSDPAWIDDHRVFDHVLAPGALYGAMAVSVPLLEGAPSATVEDLRMHNPLVFPATRSGEATDEEESARGARKVQVVVSASAGARQAGQRVEIFSKGEDEQDWTLHAEALVSEGVSTRGSTETATLDGLRRRLSPRDVDAYYRAKAETGIQLGPSFQSLQSAWSGPLEALGEVALPDGVESMDSCVHPVLLDGCFQVFSAARSHADAGDHTPYLPFGWERLWLNGPLPDRVVCHARLKTGTRDESADDTTDAQGEVVTGDLTIYDLNGDVLGGLDGYTVKRATRAALLSAVEGLDDLLYRVVWQDQPLVPGILPAGFLPGPAVVADQSGMFTDYLSTEGVGAETRFGLLADLEVLSRRYALATLDRLGWQRNAGNSVDPESLREDLGVLEEHRKVFRRMLEMLARSGVLKETDGVFEVLVGSGEPLPAELPEDAAAHATHMEDTYPHGLTEIGLFCRCGGALPEVLRGDTDPLTLLFSSGEPSAADLYLKAPVARAANRMLAEAVETLLAELPDGRRLRIVEVGAGTGSATASVLPELPPGRFDYTYTDISAGFFAEAEGRFGGVEAGIEYRVLDIEKDPVAQGFDSHGYDLVIASNVLHATRFLNETLEHCLDLLAPSGHLVALENLRGQGWLDLTFGQLDGWWRFADDYRPHHALAAPAVWRQALHDAGFPEVAFVGVDETADPDRGVIVAQGPAEVTEPAGLWVLAEGKGEIADGLATTLAARNQTVVLAREDAEDVTVTADAGVFATRIEAANRESWQALFEGLPENLPLDGVVHLAALEGHGTGATTEQMAGDTRRVAGTALALAQGLSDADATPAKGMWFITRGAQVLEREREGELVGATLWGFGKVVARLGRGRTGAHRTPGSRRRDDPGRSRQAELFERPLRSGLGGRVRTRVTPEHAHTDRPLWSQVQPAAVPDDLDTPGAPDPVVPDVDVGLRCVSTFSGSQDRVSRERYRLDSLLSPKT